MRDHPGDHKRDPEAQRLIVEDAKARIARTPDDAEQPHHDTTAEIEGADA